MKKLILGESVSALKRGETLLYPTDTVWGIGCDALNSGAIDSIYKIKERVYSKSLIVLVSSMEMLRDYVEEIPDNLEQILSSSDRPTTVIYHKPKHFPKIALAEDGSIAIRIVQDEFCKEMINDFGKPIVSTSANISGEPTPTQFKDISSEVLSRVDYVLNLRRDEINTQSSKIIDLKEDGELVVIRV